MIERVRNWLNKSGQPLRKPEDLTRENIPQHVAIIMDGNGRWATRRGLPRIAGHHAGMKAIRKIAIAADDIGVKVLTMYAFSTENWVRPKEEVDFLMKLPQEFFPLEIEELIRKNVHIRMTGWDDNVPEITLKTVQEAMNRTKDNTGLILNFAFNYGSRKEMIHGIKHVCEDVAAGKLSLDQFDEETFGNYLLTRDLPNPDLLVRTSGELRISNFMLWQLAYSELFFTPVYWPDFSEGHFYQAVYEYQRRARRYGGV